MRMGKFPKIEDIPGVIDRREETGAKSFLKTENLVDHPSHYTQGPMEVVDIIEGFGFDKDWHVASALKYIFRHNHKGNPKQDLEKAIWFLKRKVSKL